MDVMYKFMLYVAIALFAVFFILTFIPFRKRRAKNAKGKKVANSFYIKDDKVFRRKMTTYKLLTFFMTFFCCLSIVTSSLMLSRPNRKETVIEEKYTRDIFLCIDVSISVDSLNAMLIDELRNIVDEMKGERFGLVIFNTTPVVLVPLTDDYEYILQKLDDVETVLKMRYENENIDDQYISSGTLVGCNMRGSSLIGDGLASTVFNFPDLEKDKERSRLIILSTDNEVSGNQLVSLEEAADLCARNNVKVYGICTKDMNKFRREDMRRAIKSTGGKFYEEKASGSYKAIVRDIERETKSFIKEEPKETVTEYVKIPFIILVTLISTMFVLNKLSKV